MIFYKFFIFYLLFFSVSSNAETIENAHVVRIYDGDTFYIDLDSKISILSKNIPIRIRGIDAPEMRSKVGSCERQLAELSKSYLASLLYESKNTILVNIERGKYFRIVADVLSSSGDVAGLMLQYHLAIPYDGGKKRAVNWCSMLEKHKKSQSRKTK